MPSAQLHNLRAAATIEAKSFGGALGFRSPMTVQGPTPNTKSPGIELRLMIQLNKALDRGITTEPGTDLDQRVWPEREIVWRLRATRRHGERINCSSN